MTTLSEYLQTRRLKLSHTKTATAAFHLFNREAKRELKVCNIGKTFLPSSHLSWGQTGQIAYISSSPGSIAQEAMCSRFTVEETCGNRLGC